MPDKKNKFGGSTHHAIANPALELLVSQEVRATLCHVPCIQSRSAWCRTYTALSDGAYVFLVQSVTLTAILGPATETDFAVDTTGPVFTNVSVTVGCVGHCSRLIACKISLEDGVTSVGA